MNIIDYLRLLLREWKHPYRRDFLRGGVGILERFKRCERYWAPHLKLSREFITRGLHDLERAQIAVLGAGRLFDVPLREMSEVAQGIALVDADPGAVPSWRKAQKNLSRSTTTFDFLVTDVSGRMDAWTTELGRLGPNCSEREAVELFTALAASKGMTPFTTSTFDCILSVNLLSQIPLFWEDRVRAKWPHLATGPEDRMSPKVEHALAASKKLLIQEHLQLIGNLSKRRVIILTDTLFHYYTKDNAHWRTEEALGENASITLPSFTLTATDSWLWHLAPQGIERAEYGEIHKVSALLFERIGSVVS